MNKCLDIRRLLKARLTLSVLALMILFTNPIGSHVLAKGAYKADRRGTKNLKLNPDDYGRDFNE